MLEEIEKDAFLRPFTSASFDVASHVTSLLSSTSSSISELSKHIASIEQQIHSNVSTHHGDLLAQTTNVELMESVVQNCNQRSNSCFMSVGNIKTRLDDLHAECGKQVDYLENLYGTDEAVRRIVSVIEIDRRVAHEKNTADVAACVVQIEYLCVKQPKLDFLQPYHDKATSLRQNIEKQTENMLNQGLNANSVSQVSSCLQVLINLDVLEEKVVKVFGEIEKLIERDVKLALDVKVQVPLNRGAGGAVRSVLPATSVAVGQIWNNLEAVSTKLINHTNKVKLIWKAVQSGKDTASNLPFIDFIPSGELVFKKFWDNFMDIQIRHFPAVKQDFLKAAFDNEFPRLLKIFAELGSRIEENSDVQIQPSLRGVISNYEKAYLSKSLAKLFDAVNQNFVSIPTKSGLDVILRMIRSEIQVDDPMLKRLMARNVSKTVNLICVKAEQLVATDGNSTQVIGPATDSQRSNAQLVNMLDYFKSQLKEAEAVNNVEVLMQNTINPLVIAVGEAIEAIIQTMQNENFQRSNRATDYSLYMGELQSFVARASKEYFSLYKPADLVQKCGVQLASHTIDLFIRHVCLLTPLHLESTRNQILTDLNQLEIALTPMCPVLSELGKPYKLLKGFKSLLGMKMEEIVSSSIVGSAAKAFLHVMASCGVGGPGFGERLNNLEREFEAYRSRLETEERWKEILEGWILHNFSFDIQRELLRRTHGENIPSVTGKPIMSAIEYNTGGVGNSNNHQHQHNHGTATAILTANPSANLLCNYCPPAAKRKKLNNAGENHHNMNSDGRQLQPRTLTNAAGISATAVPITLTPVTNAHALIRQDTRFNADEFDPVKIFGELSTTGLATTTAGVISTAECGFGATILGFNATTSTSNILDHTTRILSFAAEGSRIEETLEIKRTAIAASKALTGGHAGNKDDGHLPNASKKTTKGKKSSKGSKASTNKTSDPSKSSGSSQRRKLKSMSIEEKYYVLQRLLKPDVSQATICEEMQLNKSVVSRIWCDRFKIEELYKAGSGNRIKVKYMHNGPAHPKKRGHGKKAKALAKQAAAAANNSKSETPSSTSSSTTSVVTPTPTTVTYHQTLQNLQQPTFARPSLLGLYAASTETLAARNYEPNNVQH
ncbi:unnamed protein product [Orchesella dallaii]|uniref:Conserved oligomeric Golgi complex subunit 5 helical domain-containing protein n=1 Tax=Orchesella dallaii TaxID=48710 RepID=A0ABP1Q969_9HEXA